MLRCRSALRAPAIGISSTSGRHPEMSTRTLTASPRENSPGSQGRHQPDHRHRHAGRQHRQSILKQTPEYDPCIQNEGGRSQHHGCCFDGCVQIAMLQNRQPKRCQSNGRSRAEQSAKLLGLSRSPRTANQETARPPIMKRRATSRISLLMAKRLCFAHAIAEST